MQAQLNYIVAMVMCAGTAAADEELWRLRQEVNNLKETLAMQSAYVQTMPPPSRPAGVQASTGTGTQYYLTVSSLLSYLLIHSYKFGQPLILVILTYF